MDFSTLPGIYGHSGGETPNPCFKAAMCGFLKKVIIESFILF